MKNTFKSIILTSTLMIIAISILSGCNTVKGVGQDLQQSGQALQKAANDNQ